MPTTYDTLAAAYAECGDFSDAQRWENTAIQHCASVKDKAAYQQRARLYAQHKANGQHNNLLLHLSLHIAHRHLAMRYMQASRRRRLLWLDDAMCCL